MGWGRRAWWPLVTALVLLASCDRPRPIEARPALWRVADGDTTIWLLGTVHVLPPAVHWETPAIAAAIDAADTLVLEVAPADNAAMNDAFFAAAKASGLPPVLDRVPPAQRAVLARGIDAAGQSAYVLDGFKTWAAALAITAGQSGAAGASRANGVEAVLTRRFRGKSIGALETATGQFMLFDRLPEAAQRVLLLHAPTGRSGDYRATLAAWAAGDEARIAATLAPEFRDAPAIEAILVTDRNARWASAIARRMARPGRVLVAVGVGHLVGPRSVIVMLRARGLRVQRVA